MIFEAVTPEEADVLADIHASAFSNAWQASEIAAVMRGPGAFGFAARQAGETAGFVLCRAIADEAEILTLATAPAHRRRGVARRLLESALKFAETGKVTKFFLEVAEDNFPAIALYESCGFRRVGARAGYYSRPEGAIAALVMRRDLNR